MYGKMTGQLLIICCFVWFEEILWNIINSLPYWNIIGNLLNTLKCCEIMGRNEDSDKIISLNRWSAAVNRWIVQNNLKNWQDFLIEFNKQSVMIPGKSKWDS